MRRLVQKGMVVALAAGFVTLLATATASAQSTGIATRTTLATSSVEVGGQSVTTYSATVLGNDGTPATGVVTLMENNHSLASAAVDSTGTAQIRYDALAAGDHSLQAVYGGDSTHETSMSDAVMVTANTTTTSPFGLAIAVTGGTSPTTMTIATPGDAGTLTATVTPTAGSGFTGFVSLSCSGAPASAGAAGGSALPTGVTCTFTPLNLELTAPTTANPTGAQTADMSLQTTPGGQTVGRLNGGTNAHPANNHPLILAVLLPGIIGLGFIGRKRKQFGKVALVLMIGAVGVLGTSACNPRYYYLNHGPTYTGTAPGTYTITVTAQTSNGVTASTQSQTLTLVVN